MVELRLHAARGCYAMPMLTLRDGVARIVASASLRAIRARCLLRAPAGALRGYMRAINTLLRYDIIDVEARRMMKMS